MTSFKEGGKVQLPEFITLPDLFFDAPPFRDAGELEAYIDGMSADFNKNVLRVLVRHLRSYLEWKKRTHKEHLDRRRFMLNYLQQHFEIIQMYINWIKPYLRHVSKLTLKDKSMRSVDLVSAFEGSMLDVEALGRYRIAVGDSGANGCVLCTFKYKTRPDMKYVQEGYQRGPVHTGWFEMELRCYLWSDEELQNYRDLKEREGLELIGNVSASVQQAMESLGDELRRYLAEAKGVAFESSEEKSSVVKKTMMERLLGDFYRAPAKKKNVTSVKQFKAQNAGVEAAKKKLEWKLRIMCWNLYKNFKKAHRMVQW